MKVYEHDGRAIIRFLQLTNERLKTKNNTMPEIKFTQEDLLERTQLSPGWRVLVPKSIDEGPGKTDPSSIVYPCKFVVDEGKEKGVPINHWFSEKAQGRIVDYIKCFVPGGKLEAGKVYELSQTIGLKVEGYCQYDPGQGYNVIKDWRPVSKGAAAK